MELAKSSKLVKNASKAEKKDIKKYAKKKAKKTVKKMLAKQLPIAAHSAYLRTILDPFNCRGVKIPDINVDASATFSITDRRTLVVGANGVCGIVYGVGLTGTSPTYGAVGSLLPYNSGLASGYTVGHVLNSAATAAALYPAATSVTNFTLTNFGSTGSTVGTLFGNVRLVSFGVRIVFTGAALNAQGKITCARAGRNTFRQTRLASAAGTGVSTIQTLPDSKVYSVPIHGGGSVIYKPMDYENAEYVQPINNYNTSDLEKALGNEIYVIVDGAVANQTFFVEAVWNFEGLPLTNALNLLEVSPSKADPISMSLAANYVSEAPATIPLPESEKKNVIDSPTEEVMQHHDKEESKEFNLTEAIVDGMSSLGKIVDSGADLVSKVMPYASAAMAFL